jgi:ribosomal protein S18 acetylase RimI-like enzyme
MFTVTRAVPEDVPAMVELLREMGDFYGEIPGEPAGAKADRINAVLFANPPLAYALLARDGSHLVGFAAYSFLWPSIHATKSLYMKELFISRNHRRSGVGKILMEHIFQIAAENDCGRAEWTTDTGNVDAQRFYESFGSISHPSKVFYRLEGREALRAPLAAQNNR